MRKWIAGMMAIVSLLCLLTACNFNTNFTDSTGNAEMKAAGKVEEMMVALTSGNGDAARNLMHPEVADRCEAAIAQMSDYVAGRKTTKLEQVSLTVNSSAGTAGNVRQEAAVFRVELEDSTVFFLSVTYVFNSDGEGFISFQIVLGAV